MRFSSRAVNRMGGPILWDKIHGGIRPGSSEAEVLKSVEDWDRIKGSFRSEALPLDEILEVVEAVEAIATSFRCMPVWSISSDEDRRKR